MSNYIKLMKYITKRQVIYLKNHPKILGLDDIVDVFKSLTELLFQVFRACLWITIIPIYYYIIEWVLVPIYTLIFMITKPKLYGWDYEEWKETK